VQATSDIDSYGIGKILVPRVVVRQARKEMPNNLAAFLRNLEN